jgi:hypothetical protein
MKKSILRSISMRNIFLPILVFTSLFTAAQDSLPAFQVINKGNNRIVISWNNKYTQTKQISIQRSPDSLNNFKTILTVPDPMNRQNGFMDTKAPDEKMFYRLYILVDGSNFIFTKAKKPVPDSLVARNTIEAKTTSPATDTALTRILQKISSNSPDSALTAAEIVIIKRYRNNRLEKIPDSLTRRIDAMIRMSNKPVIIVPMYRIISNKEGQVQITLKDHAQKKYSIRFYEDDDSFLFELKNIHEASLLMDKSNFIHAGWFKSELYDNGKLIEKNRFYIPREF